LIGFDENLIKTFLIFRWCPLVYLPVPVFITALTNAARAARFYRWLAAAARSVGPADLMTLTAVGTVVPPAVFLEVMIGTHRQNPPLVLPARSV